MKVSRQEKTTIDAVGTKMERRKRASLNSEKPMRSVFRSYYSSEVNECSIDRERGL